MGGMTSLIEANDAWSTIQAHDKYGFKVNGIYMRGSVLVFKNYTLLWDVQRAADISPRNSAMVHMLRPKVDILLVGTGDYTVNLNPSLYAYFSRKGISIEAMPTMHAIATFNELNHEGRRVAAALISREPMPRHEACMYMHEVVETAADKRLKRALARDLRQSSPDSDRLLTDGISDSIGDAAEDDRPEREDVRSSKIDEDSASIAVQYGYPGALPKDVKIVDTEIAARIAARRTRPRTAEDVEEAREAMGMRRSMQ